MYGPRGQKMSVIQGNVCGQTVKALTDGSRSLMMSLRFDINLCGILTAALSLHRLFGRMLMRERSAPLRAISNSIHEGISGLRHKLIKMLYNRRLGDSRLNNLGAGISII